MKSTEIIAVVFMLCLSLTNAYAQLNVNSNPFFEGQISLNDGSVIKGFVQVPKKSKIKRVAFKTSKDGTKETVKRKLIKSIKLVSTNGKTYRFENVPAVITFKGNSSLGTSLLLVHAKNDYVTFYVESGAYKVNSRDQVKLIYKYQYGKDFPTITYYIRKSTKPKANLFYITGHLSGIKKGANLHLTEDETLLNRINSEELGVKNIHKIIGIYMETTANL